GTALSCDNILYFKVEASDKYMKATSVECANQKWTIKYPYGDEEKVLSDVSALANAVCATSNPDPHACKFGSVDASLMQAYIPQYPTKLH
ncbi:hypothetical protein PMAYCL1PPCAC_21833, partial [Pristionchus mayeri]